ncbi:MAG: DUF1150 family protein [Alphaproteobacteria bacterium]|nr:DUF1150 family protein [Alphaproteobacteria bacterium]
MNRKESQAARQNLAAYGMHRLIYIKTIQVDERTLHALYAADGTQLLVVEARALAEATIRQHALEPVSVH